MRTSRILPSILLAFSLCGCSNKPKYVELTKETFSKLDASKVIEVDVVVVDDRKAPEDPAKWIGIYRNIFPLRDPNRISTVINCIKRANFDSGYCDGKALFLEIHLVLIHEKVPEGAVKRRGIYKNIFCTYNPSEINQIIDFVKKENTFIQYFEEMQIPFHKILFKTDEVTYFTEILCDKDYESVCGDWWESADLLNAFKGWGLFENLAKADPNWPPSHRYRQESVYEKNK